MYVNGRNFKTRKSLYNVRSFLFIFLPKQALEEYKDELYFFSYNMKLLKLLKRT